MKIIEQSDLSEEQKKRIVELWNAEYPVGLSFSAGQDFDEYLDQRPDNRQFLLFDDGGDMAGWAMTFEREGARWFAIIIDEKAQGKGFGMKMLDELKATENRLLAWAVDKDDFPKADGRPYRSPLGFYRKIGFQIHENERFEMNDVSGVKIEWNA